MGYFARIKVNFSDDVKNIDQADQEANACLIVLQEQNTINPNLIQSVAVEAVEEE